MLAAGILLCALCAWMVLGARPVAGAYAAVYIDGALYARYTLSETRSVDITGAYGGVNTLVIEDGYARCEAADCPDGLCIRQGAIGKDGQSIICLPHRLVIAVEGGEEAEADAIAR